MQTLKNEYMDVVKRMEKGRIEKSWKKGRVLSCLISVLCTFQSTPFVFLGCKEDDPLSFWNDVTHDWRGYFGMKGASCYPNKSFIRIVCVLWPEHMPVFGLRTIFLLHLRCWQTYSRQEALVSSFCRTVQVKLFKYHTIASLFKDFRDTVGNGNFMRSSNLWYDLLMLS